MMSVGRSRPKNAWPMYFGNCIIPPAGFVPFIFLWRRLAAARPPPPLLTRCRLRRLLVRTLAKPTFSLRTNIPACDFAGRRSEKIGEANVRASSCRRQQGSSEHEATLQRNSCIWDYAITGLAPAPACCHPILARRLRSAAHLRRPRGHFRQHIILT